MSAPPVLLGNVQPTINEKTKPPASPPAAGSLFDSVVASFLAVMAGILLVTQGGINTNLKANCLSSPFPSACVSFTVGAISVSSVSLVHKRTFDDTSLRKAPWYCYMGGVLGPCYVTTAIFLAARLGFAVFQLCAITGQLVSSMTCDGIGLLHLAKRPPTPKRIFAVVCVLTGAFLTSSDVDFGDEPLHLVAVYALVTFCAGGCFPLQACCNVAMGKHVKTPFRAVVMSFGVGACLLFVISVIYVAATGEMIEIRGGEWWMWCGGAAGCTLVTCNVVGVPKLGAAGFTTLFLAGQLVTALVFDAFGAFGFPVRSPTASSIAGTALAVGGAMMYQFNVQLLMFKKDEVAPTVITGKSIRSSIQGTGVTQTVKRSSIRMVADEVEEAPTAEDVADINADIKADPKVGKAKRSSLYGVS